MTSLREILEKLTIQKTKKLAVNPELSRCVDWLNVATDAKYFFIKTDQCYRLIRKDLKVSVVVKPTELKDAGLDSYIKDVKYGIEILSFNSFEEIKENEVVIKDLVSFCRYTKWPIYFVLRDETDPFLLGLVKNKKNIILLESPIIFLENCLNREQSVSHYNVY